MLRPPTQAEMTLRCALDRALMKKEGCISILPIPLQRGVCLEFAHFL